MKKTLTLFGLLIQLSLLAQSNGTVIQFDYDANGNRISRKVITLLVRPNNDTLTAEDQELDSPAALATNEKVENPDEQETENPMDSDALNSNPLSSNPQGSFDGIAKNPAPEQMVTVLAKSVNVYPNPTRNSISIRALDTNDPLLLLLRDSNGKLIRKQPMIPSGTQHIDMSDLPNGQYLLQIIADNGKKETITIIKSE